MFDEKLFKVLVVIIALIIPLSKVLPRSPDSSNSRLGKIIIVHFGASVCIVEHELANYICAAAVGARSKGPN